MLTGAYAELANQVRIWSRQLRELNMLAGRMEMGKYNKAYARMLVLRSQSELHSFASMGGSESKPDKREVELLSGKAIAEMAQTLNFVEAAAQEKLALAKQGICEPGAKRDATRVQKVIDKMDDQYDEIDSAMKKMLDIIFPAIIGNDFKPLIYLKDKRTFTFLVKGDKGLFAGFSVRHIANNGGHAKEVLEDQQTSYEKKPARAKKLFKERLGEFEINTPGEFGKSGMLQGVEFELPGGSDYVNVTYTHRDFSGSFLIRVCLHENRNKLWTALRFGIRNEEEAYKEFMFDAIYQQGLVSLSDFMSGRLDTTNPDRITYYDGNLALYQGAGKNGEEQYHSYKDSHYGKPELNRKLREVGRLFGEKFPGHYVWINDMSLPWGGSFKTKQNLTGGHNGHKGGDNADISFNNLKSKQQRVELDRIIQQVFANAGYWFHGGVGNRHWHVSIAANSAKNLPMIEGFVAYFVFSKRTPEERERTVKELIGYNFFWELYRELGKVSKEQEDNNSFWEYYRALGRLSQKNKKYFSLLKEVTKKMLPPMVG